MDVLDEELIRFWRKLNEIKVRYIRWVDATRFHEYNKATDDLDMWLVDILENASAMHLSL